VSLKANDILKDPEAVEILRIPLNKLVRSACNVRKTGGEFIDDLAASQERSLRRPEGKAQRRFW
jgi:hypothetical protein